MNSGIAKAVMAVVVSTIGALVVALGTGNTGFSHIDTKTWLIAAGSVLASGGLVWFTQNIAGVAGGIIKAVMAFLTSGIASLIVAYDDNILTRAEELSALSAAIVALGLVYQTANKP